MRLNPPRTTFSQVTFARPSKPTLNHPHPNTRHPRLFTTTPVPKMSKKKLIFAPGDPSPSTNFTSPQRAAQFTHGTLSRSSLSPSPITQFHTWFTHPDLQNPPTHLKPVQSTAETCVLSTASLPSGRVSSRTVYLKELTSAGEFVIYSNWGTSGKARDLETNKHVALCFWWKPLERQVRVEGVGRRLERGESQVYFGTRERGSRVGAWASRQTEVLVPRPGVRGEGNEGDGQEDDGRAQLEEQVRDVERKFEGVEIIPVPEFWGGLRIVPDMIEFWQGRESRLHDRFRYSRVSPSQGEGDGEGEGEWKIERLNP